MQDDRGSNVAGGDPGPAEEPAGGVRSERQRDLAAKSLRARDSAPAATDDDRETEERDDVDRRP